MKRSPRLVAGLSTSVIVATVSGATFADSAVPAGPEARSAKIADKDFGRLSADGFRAFNDIRLARIAIFDGKLDEAGNFVVADAGKLIASRDYYGASRSLKKAEDGIRFDEYVDVAGVKAKPANGAAKNQ
jgi:hypothetical protein